MAIPYPEHTLCLSVWYDVCMECRKCKVPSIFTVKSGLCRTCYEGKDRIKALYGSQTHIDKSILKSYRKMIERCCSTKNPYYHLYGGRGIKICPQWQGVNGVSTFVKDMGAKPTRQHTIDRIDNDGDYTPENCRWATKSEQASNRRSNRTIEAFGQKMILKEWAEYTGIKRETLAKRLDRGMPAELAFTLSVGSIKANQHKSNLWKHS